VEELFRAQKRARSRSPSPLATGNTIEGDDDKDKTGGTPRKEGATESEDRVEMAEHVPNYWVLHWSWFKNIANGVGNCRNVNISVPEIKGAPSAEQEAAPPPPLPAPAVPPPGPVVAKAVVVQPTPPAPSM